MISPNKDENFSKEVIESFGQEWARFDYSENFSDDALDAQFLAYSNPLDLGIFDSASSIAGDFGAGSGRWTSRLLPYFAFIYALEPSEGANEVLVRKFCTEPRIEILKETIGANSIPDNSLDLAMSLGVLHHIPDTGLAMKHVSAKIKSGGFLLCYLYYSLEGKPFFYRVLFKLSNTFRWVISRLPYSLRILLARLIAIAIYLPLARISALLEKKGKRTSNIPLHHYANMPFVMLLNDALDRFGTRLEQRFSRSEITELLEKAGFDLSTLKFSNIEPFWTFSVQKL